MRMAFIGLGVWIALEPLAAWALNCDPLQPRGGSDLRQEVQGEVDAKIHGLLGRVVGAGASIDGIYQYIQKDVLKGYDQSSQLYVWERLIYLKCEQLNDSSATDADKSAQFNELMEAMLVGPPDIEQSEKAVDGALFVMEAMIIAGNGQRPELTRIATKKLQSLCNGERSCIVFLDEDEMDLKTPFQSLKLRYICGQNGEEIEERYGYGRSARLSCD